MPKGLSLHIGLNSVDPAHYEGWSGPLDACELDANDMQSIAKAQGFTHTSLLTGNATRGNVTAALQAAAGALAEGDMFFLSYAGHGGQVPDTNSDESDETDETWCLYDGQLIDDELYFQFSQFKPGVRVFVLSDSCHSGTVTRDRLAEAPVMDTQGRRKVYRAMPREKIIATYMAHRDFYNAIQTRSELKEPEVRASVLLISGCQDNQLSQDGMFNGLFTGKLKSCWNGGAYKGNHKKFHQAILNLMPSEQSPNYYAVGNSNPAFEDQRPFTIG